MPDFIGTREAAKLLGVSEASVRRWADAGLLTSHRVGLRGERRFERSSVASLGSATDPGRSGQPATEVILEGSSIPLHTHLSSYYTSLRGRLRLGVPFLRDGILAGQSCILMADSKTEGQFEAELSQEAIDLARARERGQWLRLAPFADGDEGLVAFEAAFAAITRRGGVTIRLLGEALQNRDQLGSLASLLRFEERLHSLVRRYPVVMLCQYDARSLDGDELVAVLKAHADNFDRSLRIFLN
jgi:excisionase family DNA binding protein